MKPYLILNNINVIGLVAQDGLTQSETYRQQREVVTLDGTKYMTSIAKRTLSIQFVTISMESWQKICRALYDRPVMVQYVDEDTGEAAKLFYVTSKEHGTKRYHGGHLWVTPSLELEER